MVDELFEVSDAEAGVVVLHVHAHPGAGRTAVVGRHGDALKVRVAAQPEGGRANDACAALLAETFGAAKGSVSLVSGASSRMKRFRIEGVDIDDFRVLLERVVEEGTSGQGPRRKPTEH